jgi:Holliday junction resolvasome RuvABC endonuclease subunit
MTVTFVVGLDLSLASTGVARVSSAGQLTTQVVESKGKRADTLVDRHHRLRGMTERILGDNSSASLAVIEGCVAVAGGSSLDRHALWWNVVSGLMTRGVPVAVIAPSSLKKAIAGHGRADKVAVAMAISRMYPDDHDQLTGNDVADAAGLAHLGAVRLGWDVNALERHRDIVKFTEWPAARLKEAS